MPFPEKAAEIAAVLRTVLTGRYALALAGSYAKGTADEGSDLDFFLFLENPKPYEERKQIIESIADTGCGMWVSPDLKDGPWGGGMDFRFRGTPVEVTVRWIDSMEESLSRALKGELEVLPAAWTTHGYYTYVCLSEVNFIQPVEDPYGILAGWKVRAAEYPPLLRRAILSEFMGRSGMWLDNFHYDSAIERADIWFAGPIVTATLLDMVQVVLALNGVFYTGDKKLEKQLAALRFCPPELREQAEFLLSAPRDPQKLREQRQILRRIYAALEAEQRRLGF